MPSHTAGRDMSDDELLLATQEVEQKITQGIPAASSYLK